MSSTPVVRLRALQTTIHGLTGVEIPLLDLSEALLEHMTHHSIRFTVRAMQSYHDRLRNWRTADQVILTKFHAIRKDRRATFEDIQAIYEIYRGICEAQGITPMGLYTFRVRAYQIPIPRRPIPAGILMGP